MSYLVKEVDSKDVFFFKKVLRKKNKSRVIYSVDDKSSYAHRENGLRAFLRLQPQKSTSYPQKTARNRSGEFYGGE